MTAPQISFVAFIATLVRTAAIHFGDAPDPETGKPGSMNLDAANQTIQLLALLEDKTRGNLDPEESRFLEQALFELRMRYLHARTPASGPQP